MKGKFLTSSREIFFTRHARDKMRFYHLSEQRVRRVLHSPLRIEEGIAPGTVAMMQRAGGKKPYELWAMLVKTQISADKKSALISADNSLRKSAVTKIISAWRYPGITKPGEPLPEEIIRELKEIGD